MVYGNKMCGIVVLCYVVASSLTGILGGFYLCACWSLGFMLHLVMLVLMIL